MDSLSSSVSQRAMSEKDRLTLAGVSALLHLSGGSGDEGGSRDSGKESSERDHCNNEGVRMGSSVNCLRWSDG